MNLPLFVARRYLFAKKSHNVINIISAISVVGIALGTMALVVVLAGFGGFERMAETMYSTFDSDIKITAEKGKTFVPDSVVLRKIRTLKGVTHLSQTVEENVLLEYAGRQAIALMKGVDDEYEEMTTVGSLIPDERGGFNLHNGNAPRAVIANNLAIQLGLSLRFIEPLTIHIPKRGSAISTVNPLENVNMDVIYPSGIFNMDDNFQYKYVFVPIAFARDLLEYTNQTSSIEIMLDSTVNTNTLQKQIATIVGDGFNVKNRYEQNAALYRMMKSEKLVVYGILIFIICIISFNIVGSLFMLIIEKKKDIATFRNIGANTGLIKRIFLFEGWLISLSGMVAGLVCGLLLCFLQQRYGMVKLPGGIVDAYPITVHWGDVLLVVASITAIGYIAAWIPVTYLSKHLIGGEE